MSAVDGRIQGPPVLPPKAKASPEPGQPAGLSRVPVASIKAPSTFVNGRGQTQPVAAPRPHQFLPSGSPVTNVSPSPSASGSGAHSPSVASGHSVRQDVDHGVNGRQDAKRRAGEDGELHQPGSRATYSAAGARRPSKAVAAAVSASMLNDGVPGVTSSPTTSASPPPMSPPLVGSSSSWNIGPAPTGPLPSPPTSATASQLQSAARSKVPRAATPGSQDSGKGKRPEESGSKGADRSVLPVSQEDDDDDYARAARDARRPSTSSILDRPRPVTPDIFSKRKDTDAASAKRKEVIPLKNRGPKAAEEAAPAKRSGMKARVVNSSTGLDRPRPKTPEAFGDEFAAPARRSSQERERPQPGGYNTFPTRSAGVLDRPRPKTPDANMFMSASPRMEEHERSRSELGMRRPSELNNRHHGLSASTSDASLSSTSHESAERPRAASVLDRPRPKTPDAVAMMSGGGLWGKRPSMDESRGGFGPSTSSSSVTSYQSARSDQQQRAATPDARSRLESVAGSTSGLARSTPASAYSSDSDYRSYGRPSIDSGFSREGSVAPSPSRLPPSLSLDLDLGSTGDSDMFDLANLLKAGQASPVKKERKVPPRLDLEPPTPVNVVLPLEDENRTPVATTFMFENYSLNSARSTAPSDQDRRSPAAAPPAINAPAVNGATLAAPLPSQGWSPDLSGDDRSSTKSSNSTSRSLKDRILNRAGSVTMLDKSLPPTPMRSEGEPAPKKESLLQRQVSKLRLRQGSMPATTNANGGFALLSATTTKKAKARSGSVSSDVGSSHGRGSIDAGVPNHAPFQHGHVEIPPRRGSTPTLLVEARSASALGMSLPAARRSEDLLRSSRNPAEEEHHAASVDGHYARSVDGHGASGGQPHRRRGSFDLLTQKLRPDGRRPSTDRLLDRATTPTPAEDESRGTGRLSFDMLRRAPKSSQPAGPKQVVVQSTRPGAPRRPSTDKLLTIATNKLSGLTGRAVSPSPEPPSPASAHSIDISPEKATVAAATRVMRRDSNDVPAARPFSPPNAVRATASPTLVKNGPLVKPPPPNDAAAADAPPAGVSASSWHKRKIPDSGVGSDSSLSSAWLDLEDTLNLYTKAVASDRADRGNMLSNTLLPFLKREEGVSVQRQEDVLAKRQRQVLFGWLGVLTKELKTMQPAHRGTCLEALAAVAESHFLSPAAFGEDEAGQVRYRSMIVSILQFAVSKLNEKAVYANTLVFSGRVLALAFFRIEGVALKLLRALPPVKRACLRRVLVEANVDALDLPAVDLDMFPSHLTPLCLRDFREYTDLLLPLIPKPTAEDDRFLVKDGVVVVEMTGNWLIRWTASDSDLPFAFYRAYHRQLASYLIPYQEIDHIEQLDSAQVVTAPGFLFLAASLLEKCDALVHRNLRSVTSIGPGNGANFNTTDSANLTAGQKPKVLEVANRRLVSTMLDIVGGPPVAEGAEAPPDTPARRAAFSQILQVWIRACVKKTSMWDTRSIFILLDLIEGLIYTLSYPPPPAKSSTESEIIVPRPAEDSLELFDVPFIFSFVKTILLNADNTVALMRTIAFVYAHFEIFTMRSKDRDGLCEGIILDDEVFSRLYLHWNAGVRGYFIRLLVWRLARLGVVAEGGHRPVSSREPRIVAIFGVMNTRLEAIRRRHDELEPAADSEADAFFHPKRSTICSTTGVKEAPFAVDELFTPPNEIAKEDMDESLRNAALNSGRKGSASMSRVVGWLKVGLNKAKKDKQQRLPGAPDAKIDPFHHTASQSSLDTDDDRGDTASESSYDFANSSDGGHGASDSEHTELPVPPAVAAAAAAAAATPDTRRHSRLISPAFFSFEFEGGIPPRSDVEPATGSPTKAAPAARLASPASATETIAESEGTLLTPTLRRQNGQARPRPQSGLSPRMSVRFSKRASILPPAALDLLQEVGQTIPPIPDKYLTSSGLPSYDQRLHPYAVRGLRDYEDALDEWTDWVARLQAEEEEGKKHSKGFVDAVPRLLVAWPSVFGDD